MRGRGRFSPARYRRQRLVALERRCEYLARERSRLERLLAITLQVATSGTSVTPTALLAVVCELDGTNPGRAEFVNQRKDQS
jgi:hypothetical protein